MDLNGSCTDIGCVEVQTATDLVGAFIRAGMFLASRVAFKVSAKDAFSSLGASLVAQPATKRAAEHSRLAKSIFLNIVRSIVPKQSCEFSYDRRRFKGKIGIPGGRFERTVSKRKSFCSVLFV